MRDYAKDRIMRLHRYVEKMSLCNYHNAYYGQEDEKKTQLRNVCQIELKFVCGIVTRTDKLVSNADSDRKRGSDSCEAGPNTTDRSLLLCNTRIAIIIIIIIIGSRHYHHHTSWVT